VTRKDKQAKKLVNSYSCQKRACLQAAKSFNYWLNEKKRIQTPVQLLHPHWVVTIIVDTMIETEAAEKFVNFHYRITQFREELKSLIQTSKVMFVNTSI